MARRETWYFPAIMEPKSDSDPRSFGGDDGELGLRFHHVGIAVDSIEDALETYVGVLGFEQVGAPTVVPAERVRVCFVKVPPGLLLELIEGLDESSPVTGVLQRRGPGAYHVCYQVDDLDRAVRQLRSRRCLPFRRFEAEEEGGRHRFAFLLSPHRELFELCEVADREGR